VTGGDRGYREKKSNRSVFAVHFFDFTALVAIPILVERKRGRTLNEQPKPLSIQSKSFSLHGANQKNWISQKAVGNTSSDK
jgi:hypothetical protein